MISYKGQKEESAGSEAVSALRASAGAGQSADIRKSPGGHRLKSMVPDALRVC